MKKYTFYILLLLLFNSCIEEISLQNFESTNLLIVESELTDELKQQTVKLSRTIPLDSINQKKESAAIVSVNDNLGNSFNFSEFKLGVYKSNTAFKAKTANSYTLNIQTSNGEFYQSTPQKIVGKNDISDLYAIADEDTFGDVGVRIIVESNNENTKAKYYKYTYEEAYVVKAPYWSTDSIEIVSYGLRTFKTIPKKKYGINRRICYNSSVSNSILQAETNSISSNSIKYPIRFISQKNPIIWHRYSMLAIQHTQSYEAYTYYQTLDKLSTNENVFSQVQTGYLQGNVFPTDNADNPVIGFFEVNSVSKKRFFFNFSDIFPKHDINFQGDCQKLLEHPPIIDPLSTPKEPLESPLIAAITYRRLVFAKESGEPKAPYFVVPINCTDCRYAASSVKPNFWID